MDDCLTDVRNDTPPPPLPLLSPPQPSSSSLAASTAVTSPCSDDVTGRCAGSHVGAAVRHGAADLYRRPVHLGLKKCFHCAHCRYSTDRKNNLKRHLGTMHRDHYVAGVTELDQTRYHVSVHRRESCRSCVDDCGGFVRRPLNKRHLAGVLIDDLAPSGDVDTTRNDDANAHPSTERSPSPPTGSQTDDVSTRGPLSTQSGDVSTGRDEDDDARPLPPSPVDDYRNALPRFEPRPASAYGRHSSRMFFYDRLRSTHDHNDADQSLD